MAAEAAFTELRTQLLRLRALLKVLRGEGRRMCPYRRHKVAHRIQDAVTEMRGWLRKALAAVNLSLTALRGDGGGSMLRTLLTRFDLHWRNLRRTFGREVGGACRMEELKELAASTHLPPGERRWARWVRQVKPPILAVRRQLAAVTRNAGECWRELAARVGPGITINNVAVGQEFHGHSSLESDGTDHRNP